MRKNTVAFAVSLVIGIFLSQSIYSQPVKKKPRTRAIPQGVVQMEIKVTDVKSRSMDAPVVQSKTNEDRAQPVHDTMLTPDHLVIKALDEKGTVLEKYYRRDPRLVRVEGYLQDKPGAR